MAGTNTPIGSGTLLRAVENRTSSYVVNFSDGTDHFSLGPGESKDDILYQTGRSALDGFKVESLDPNANGFYFVIWQDSNGTPGEKLNISQSTTPDSGAVLFQPLPILKDNADYKMVVEDIGICIEDVSVDGPGFAFNGVSERYFHVFYCNGAMNAIPSKICETN